MRKSPEERDSWRLLERRREARYTLILRAGILEQAGKSSLCLVKNVSVSGLQVKFYTPPIPGVEVSVRVADEPPVHGRIIWVKGDIAGIAFREELDTPTLLRVQQKLSSKRRRATPRVSVESVATLQSGGQTYRATVCDISSHGARVRTRAELSAGDRFMISLQDMPTIRGYVRWSDGEESGLAFEPPIPMQIMASWVDDRVGLSG
jgi:PilZ domain